MREGGHICGTLQYMYDTGYVFNHTVDDDG